MTRPTAYFPNSAYPASWQEHSLLGDTNGSLTQLADIPTTAIYSASGAISVTAAASAFAAWPSQGCVFNVTQNELMFYTANSGTVLTVPALGRALGGTSLHAGVIADSVRFLEARALGMLLNQLIAEVVAMETELRYGFGVCNGRITLTSGTPVTDLSVNENAQSIVYFTPYKGNRISIFDGTVWKMYTFTEKSISLSGLTSGKNYDVFIYDNAGTLTLELSAAWTNDNTRAGALTTQDGIYVKSGATSRRYLGTIRTTGTTTTENSQTKRFVWNYYNRIIRSANINEVTFHSYTGAARAWNNNSASTTVSLVIGIADEKNPVIMDLRATFNSTVATEVTSVYPTALGSPYSLNSALVASMSYSTRSLMLSNVNLGYNTFYVTEVSAASGSSFTSVIFCVEFFG